MEHQIIKVKGMYCPGCEGRIQNRLIQLEGVEGCAADYRKEEVRISYDGEKVSRETICQQIEALGYETAESQSRNLQIISILAILLALYLIASHLGLLTVFNLFPAVETTMGYGMLLVIGLLTSVHCIAMCGGINLTQSVLSVQNAEAVAKSNLLYNLGRVSSYTLIGGIVGGIGGVIGFNGRMRGIIAILAGCAMLVMAVQMLGVFRSVRKLRLHMPHRLTAAVGRLVKGKSSFWIGFLNGFMPCGPLQSMQIYALSTGSFLQGALSMLLFSIGTVPLMFGFGVFSGNLNRKYTKYMLTVSACIIFVMGLSMVGNGLSLSGAGLPSRMQSDENAAILSGTQQTVRSEVDYGSYESITVKNNVPVVWTIYVPEGKLNGCNQEIVVPEYGLDVKLTEGENVVAFTPERAGTVPFTCWMGMIKGSIYVVA